MRVVCLPTPCRRPRERVVKAAFHQVGGGVHQVGRGVHQVACKRAACGFDRIDGGRLATGGRRPAAGRGRGKRAAGGGRRPAAGGWPGRVGRPVAAAGGRWLAGPGQAGGWPGPGQAGGRRRPAAGGRRLAGSGRAGRPAAAGASGASGASGAAGGGRRSVASGAAGGGRRSQAAQAIGSVRPRQMVRMGKQKSRQARLSARHKRRPLSASDVSDPLDPTLLTPAH